MPERIRHANGYKFRNPQMGDGTGGVQTEMSAKNLKARRVLGFSF